MRLDEVAHVVDAVLLHLADLERLVFAVEGHPVFDFFPVARLAVAAVAARGGGGGGAGFEHQDGEARIAIEELEGDGSAGDAGADDDIVEYLRGGEFRRRAEVGDAVGWFLPVRDGRIGMREAWEHNLVEVVSLRDVSLGWDGKGVERRQQSRDAQQRYRRGRPHLYRGAVRRRQLPE